MLVVATAVLGEDDPVPTPAIPHGATALRVTWDLLPPHLRAVIEGRCGSPVVGAHSQGGGYTPGLASVLTCADGSRHFVKAASVAAQRTFAESYRIEAAHLATLPATAPAPALRWLHDDGDWVALGIAHVEARSPARPWSGADLTAAVRMLETVARTLTPVPAAMSLQPIAVELGDLPEHWERLDTRWLGLPGFAEHHEEAAGLAAGFAAVTAGDTVVHTDVRDDNLLLDPGGRMVLCDWNWLCRGAAWFDTVTLMIGPAGDGLDVEAVLAAAPLTRDVEPAHVDAVLALVTGYFLGSAQHPVPPTSPHVRDAQRLQGEAGWHWLAARRGWR